MKQVYGLFRRVICIYTWYMHIYLVCFVVDMHGWIQVRSAGAQVPLDFVKLF